MLSTPGFWPVVGPSTTRDNDTYRVSAEGLISPAGAERALVPAAELSEQAKEAIGRAIVASRSPKHPAQLPGRLARLGGLGPQPRLPADAGRGRDRRRVPRIAAPARPWRRFGPACRSPQRSRSQRGHGATEAGLERPDAIRALLGAPTSETQGGGATGSYLWRFYDCLGGFGDVIRNPFYTELDRFTTTEHDLIGALPERDRACIRDTLSASGYETLLADRPNAAPWHLGAANSCITPEGLVAVTISLARRQSAELTAETRACLA